MGSSSKKATSVSLRKARPQTAKASKPVPYLTNSLGYAPFTMKSSIDNECIEIPLAPDPAFQTIGAPYEGRDGSNVNTSLDGVNSGLNLANARPPQPSHTTKLTVTSTTSTHKPASLRKPSRFGSKLLRQK